MGRPRTRDKHLPQRVYLRRGTYYYVERAGRWHPLGRTEAAMYRALSELLGDRPPERTMADLIAAYRAEVLPKKAAETQRKQAAELTRLAAVFGRMRPDALLARHIAAWHDKRGVKSPTAANRELALLSDLCRYAVRKGAMPANPCREVQRHTETPRSRYVEDHEFAAVRELAGPRERLMMDLAYLLGRREGEILRITRRDITPDGIHVTPSKRGRKLLIRWTPAVREVIEAALARQPVASLYVVADRRGQPVPVETFRTAWGRIMTRALATGAIEERFTFHDLRAKAATDGRSGEHLGHTSESVLERVYRRKPKPVMPTR